VRAEVRLWPAADRQLLDDDRLKADIAGNAPPPIDARRSARNSYVDIAATR